MLTARVELRPYTSGVTRSNGGLGVADIERNGFEAEATELDDDAVQTDDQSSEVTEAPVERQSAYDSRVARQKAMERVSEASEGLPPLK